MEIKIQLLDGVMEGIAGPGARLGEEMKVPLLLGVLAMVRVLKEGLDLVVDPKMEGLGNGQLTHPMKELLLLLELNTILKFK